MQIRMQIVGARIYFIQTRTYIHVCNNNDLPLSLMNLVFQDRPFKILDKSLDYEILISVQFSDPLQTEAEQSNLGLHGLLRHICQKT